MPISEKELKSILTGAFSKYPVVYFYGLVEDVHLVDTDAPYIAWADGADVYFNKKIIDALTTQTERGKEMPARTVFFYFGHETLHNMMSHPQRLMNLQENVSEADRNLFNFLADVNINEALSKTIRAFQKDNELPVPEFTKEGIQVENKKLKDHVLFQEHYQRLVNSTASLILYLGGCLGVSPEDVRSAVEEPEDYLKHPNPIIRSLAFVSHQSSVLENDGTFSVPIEQLYLKYRYLFRAISTCMPGSSTPRPSQQPRQGSQGKPCQPSSQEPKQKGQPQPSSPSGGGQGAQEQEAGAREGGRGGTPREKERTAHGRRGEAQEQEGEARARGRVEDPISGLIRKALSESAKESQNQFNQNEAEAMANSAREVKKQQEEGQLSKDKSQRISEEFKESIAERAKATARRRAEAIGKEGERTAGTGTTPLDRLIEVNFQPKIDWKRILRDLIGKNFRNAWDTYKVGRRTSVYRSIIPPIARVSEIKKRYSAPYFVIGVDTSGSISDKEFKSFISEIYGIFSQLRAHKPKGEVVLWDTELKSKFKIQSSNASQVLRSLRRSYGGTDVKPFLEHARKTCKANRSDRCVAVILTDGCFFTQVSKSDRAGIDEVIAVLPKYGACRAEVEPIADKIIEIDT